MIGKTDSSAELLEFCVELARAAGDRVQSRLGARPAPERKADGTWVTAADRAAETLMRERILARYPNDEVLGEEFGASAGSASRRWIIDPIDGTFSFVHGVPLFGVLIGIEIEGVASIGVAHYPALGDTLAAARGLGCRLNGELVRTSQTKRLADALVVTNDPFAAEKLVRSAGSFRGWGDCYGYLLVASGRADIALDPVMQVWDCAALAPIVEEAGGTFTDWKGARTIRGGNGVATNGFLFEEAIERLR